MPNKRVLPNADDRILDDMQDRAYRLIHALNDYRAVKLAKEIDHIRLQQCHDESEAAIDELRKIV